MESRRSPPHHISCRAACFRQYGQMKSRDGKSHRREKAATTTTTTAKSKSQCSPAGPERQPLDRSDPRWTTVLPAGPRLQRISENLAGRLPERNRKNARQLYQIKYEYQIGGQKIFQKKCRLVVITRRKTFVPKAFTN